MKKNIKGFTLIELLAVIVILAIIALIAVPVIMNIISKANKSAFKDTAYGVIQAGELYYAEQLLEPNGMESDVTIALPDTTKKLQIKGEVPTGSILITKEGKVAIAVHNNRYCVTKGLDDKDVIITENYESCDLPKMLVINKIMSSYDGCIKTGVCEPGTEVKVAVNNSKSYNFYVISDDGNEMTLIMDRNIYEEGNTTEPDVAWINASDYAEANADDNTSCSYTSCNDEGPITAVAALKERTSSWSNIPEREYTYSDDSGENMYSSFTETMRARMLTYTEANNIKTANNNTMPTWMYINLNGTGDNNTSGYWISTADTFDSSDAWYVRYNGNIAGGNAFYAGNGVRPVITLSK